MPYLTKEEREKFDPFYQSALSYLLQLDVRSLTGHLNYMIFKTVRGWTIMHGKKYYVFAALLGTMICCILEIYRRLVAPYEDRKIKENGDVF
jgi:hypothetical protein